MAHVQRLTTVPGTWEVLRQPLPPPPGLRLQRHFSILGGISALVSLHVTCAVPRVSTFAQMLHLLYLTNYNSSF